MMEKSEHALENALHQVELRYNRLLAAATAYVFTVMTENGRVTGTNHGPGSTAVTGYGPGDYENDCGLWLRMVHEEDRRAVLQQVTTVLKGQTPAPVEHRLLHKDNTLRWVRNFSVPRHDGDGRTVAYDGLLTDITSYKHAHETVRRTRAELSTTEKALGRALADLNSSRQALKETEHQLMNAEKFESLGTLAAAVVHEVKNPLQTVLLGLNYLSKTIPSDNENAAMAMDEMGHAVKRANSVIQELLQVAGEAGHQPRPEDVNAVVERSLALMKYQISAGAITLVCELAAGLARANIDSNKVEHVLLNLLSNALQAMATGGTLTVRTRTEFCREDPARLDKVRHFGPGTQIIVIEVQDTGPGIPVEHLPRIFDAFFTTKAASTGTGLGLSIVKKIIDLHGARIELENALPTGVVARVMLRAAAE